MELANGGGRAAAFIAASGALTTPLMLIDVGARGGISARWGSLESALQVYGFDAETVVPAPNERHRFFELAIGDRDGVVQISTPENPYESRISAEGGRTVELRKLDTLWREGLIPPADFLKVDVEGFEPQVLAGAAEYLKASPLLGADFETTFNSNAALPLSHLGAIMGPLFASGLRVADFAFDRPDLSRALEWPGTCNALFTRDLSAPETRDPEPVLKLLAILDIYGLPAQAFAVLKANRAALVGRIDVRAVARRLRPTAPDHIERRLPHLGLGLWSTAKRITSFRWM